MPQRDQEAVAQEVFAALADPTRREVFERLAAGPVRDEVSAALETRLSEIL